MTTEHILSCLGDVNEAYIEEAAPGRRRKRRLRWWAAAACVCLAALGVFALTRADPAPHPDDGLPLLTVPNYDGGAMGFEGLLYFDAEELSNGNPWTEDMALETLPVYRNGSYDTAGAPRGLEPDVVRERLEAAAAVLDIPVSETEEMPSYLEGDTSSVGLRTISGESRLESLADGTITLSFPDGLALPEEYRFTYSDTSAEEAEAVLQYLASRYADFLHFQEPELILSGDYNVYGEYIQNYHAYDAAGNDTEDILNYNFRFAQFAPDDNGRLMLLRRYDGLLTAEKLGDYPLITVEEAQEALLRGQYQTSVPMAMPGEEFIVKAELVYRGGPTDEYFLPYYRFYAELPDSEELHTVWDNGLKTFGAYYVPAVQPQYLTNIPTYDGHF